MNPTATAETKSRGLRILKRILFILLAALLLWALVGFLATIPVVGEHPYWRTLRAQPKDFGLDAEDVSFLSLDGIRLTAWYIPAHPAARGTVIVAHGINGNRSDMLPRAAFLVKGGYNTLLLDLRGHGGSGGNYVGPGYMESLDILGAVSYLRKRGDQPQIFTMGHSYGAVAALFAASQSPYVAGVISDGAFISYDDMVKRATILLSEDPERSIWERIGLRLAGFRATEYAVLPIYYLRTGVWFNGRKADTLRAIARIGTRPILFIAGERDKICPPQNARIMYDAALSPFKDLLLVPNADHDSTFTAAPQEYESTVLSFLKKVSLTDDGGRGKKNLPHLQPSRPERRGAGEQIVSPHSTKSLVILLTQPVPVAFKIVKPRHQCSIVVGAPVLQFLDNEQPGDRPSDLRDRGQMRIGENISLDPRIGCTHSSVRPDR